MIFPGHEITAPKCCNPLPVMSLRGGEWVWNVHTTWATKTDVQGSSARMESFSVSPSWLISFSQTLMSSPEGTEYEQGRSQPVSRYDTQMLPPSSFSCPRHRQPHGSCPKRLSRRPGRESRHTLNRAKVRIKPREFAPLCHSKRRLVAAARRIPIAFRVYLQDDGTAIAARAGTRSHSLSCCSAGAADTDGYTVQAAIAPCCDAVMLMLT